MAIKLKVDGTSEELLPANGESFTPKELQDAVGGYIQIIGTPGGRLLCMDEDGKFKNKPVNAKATEIGKSCGILPGDLIVGDVVWLTNKEMGD